MRSSNNHDSESKQIIYVPTFSDLSQNGAEDGIDLLELWSIIWRGKWFISGFTLGCALVAVYITMYVLPVMYKSDVVIMPMDAQGGTMGSLAGTLPLPITMSAGKADSITSFLNSRTLNERLLTKYDLLSRLYPNLWDKERKEWIVENPEDKPSIVKILQGNASRHQVSKDKTTNLITISWEDQDPVFAALMLKRIIAELQYYLDNEYETDAKREREFVTAQFAKATGELEYWERQVPRQDLPLSKIQRELLSAQEVYTELRKQLELAKISEAKELVRFKVLDQPLVPEIKFKPNRSSICALTLVASGMFAVFLVFGFNIVRNQKKREGSLKKINH